MTDPAEVVRIIIADDHPMFREGLRLVLSGADGFEVVGEAEDGHQAVALALEAQPDVAIMDLNMPRLLATRDPGTVFPELTRREHEVLGRVAAGESNGEIARALTLSDKTVRNHISNLFTKLQVATRAQAIVRAREAGLGLTDDGPDAASPPVGRSGSA